MDEKQIERKLTKLFYKMLKIVKKTNTENCELNLKSYQVINTEYTELIFQRKKLLNLPQGGTDKFDRARNALSEVFSAIMNPDHVKIPIGDILAESVKIIQEK